MLVLDNARTMGTRRVILWSDTRFADVHRLYHGMGLRLRGRRDLNDSYDSSKYGIESTLSE